MPFFKKQTTRLAEDCGFYLLGSFAEEIVEDESCPADFQEAFDLGRIRKYKKARLAWKAVRNTCQGEQKQKQEEDK